MCTLFVSRILSLRSKLGQSINFWSKYTKYRLQSFLKPLINLVVHISQSWHLFFNSHLFQEIYWWYTAQPPGGHLQGCLRGFNVKLTQVGYWQTLQPCNKHCNIAKKHCKNCKSYLNISHLPIGNAIHCHGCQLQSYKDYLGLFNFPFYSVFSSSSFCSAPFYHCSG